MSDIVIIKNYKFANAITHTGRFHADEVLATIILSKILKPLKLYRANSISEDVCRSMIIYDIGLGKFDHHQKNRNGTRNNGVPYASAGLIWKEFGPKIVANESNPFLIWQYVDRDFIQGVDAADNDVLPKVAYPTDVMGFNQIIDGFNPLWDSEEDSDIAFMKAIKFANVVFDNVYANSVAKAKAKQIVEEAIYKSSNHIIILPKNMPWKEFVMDSCNKKARDIQFVIYPSLKAGYVWECVPQKSIYNEFRKPVPIEWRGLYNDSLRKVTGIKTATFCDSDGFTGGAETLEDTIKFVRLALKN